MSLQSRTKPAEVTVWFTSGAYPCPTMAEQEREPARYEVDFVPTPWYVRVSLTTLKERMRQTGGKT